MSTQAIPVVILPGIGQSKVQVVDADGKVLRDAWPISADPEKVIGPLKGPLMKMMLFRRDAGFSDAAADAIGSFVDDLTIFPDGNNLQRLQVLRWSFPLSEYNEDQRRYLNKMVPVTGLAEKIGEDNIFFFAYNSFGDAYRTADELDAYIQNVKQRTGAEKVNLMAVSLGGSLALAYFDKYVAKQDVQRLVCVVSAMGGTHLLADMMDGDFALDDPRQLIHDLGEKTEETFGDMLDMLPEGVLEATLEKSVAAIVEKIAVNSTVMWGAVPRDRYILLKQKYLLDGKHDRIAADADRLHRRHVDMRGFVEMLQANGTQVFNLCAYGKRLFPLCASGEYMSDGIVDSASASMGAVFSAPGGQFAADYVPANADVPNAISADRSVDASACVLPDRTWFFADQGHDAIAKNKTALQIVEKLLSDADFDSVYADPAYPRFNGNHENGSCGE